MEQVAKLPNLLLCGLMCIPAVGQPEQIQREAFTKMTAARDYLEHTYPLIQQLSMGMSGDLTNAIACGSTIVRIGTDIFGARSTFTPKP